MDERSERGHKASDTFEQGVTPMDTSRVLEAAYDPENDPVLKALRAAPWVQISAEELAELDELARNIGPTIPYDKFMAALEVWCAQEAAREQQDVSG